MLVIKNEDYLSVSINSLVADYDREILINLYQPILGYKAIGLYFTLLTEANNQKINPIISHEQLFNRMQINAGEFVDSRHLLEASGLLKTFVSELKGNKLYQYELYAPKTPTMFFNNTLLNGMLMKSIGESEAIKLKNIYTLNKNADGKEITASFMEVFSPDLDDPIFRKAMEKSENVISRQSAKMKSGFSYELFFEELSKRSQIKESAFSKNDMKEIERLASLYGVNEETAALNVAELYDPLANKNHRVDFDELAKRFQEETNYRFLSKGGNTRRRTGRIHGTTDLANKINLMEALSPKDYLSVLQNGSTPASSDLKLINDLSKKFRLPNSVINAIVDYVLAINDNVLSKAFAEKIAGSLAREGIQTTIDAMDYLKKVSSKGRKKKEESVEINEVGETIIEEEKPRIKRTRAELLKLLEEGDDNGED